MLSTRALAPLLGYLRGLGVVVSGLPEPQAPADQLARRFAEYLAGERGLTADRVRSYTGVARRFLAEVAIGDDADAGALTLLQRRGGRALPQR